MKNPGEAKEFLKKAMKIFEEKNHQKYLKEVKLTINRMSHGVQQIGSEESSKEKEQTSEEKSN